MPLIREALQLRNAKIRTKWLMRTRHLVIIAGKGRGRKNGTGISIKVISQFWYHGSH